MEPFIKNHQYNMIKKQAGILAGSHSTVVDPAVLNTLESLAMEKITGLFTEMDEEQQQLISSIVHVTSKEEAAIFLAKVKPYVIPFPIVDDHMMKKLFPKAKKLKAPSLEDVDLQTVSYLSWIDKGSHKKYLIAEYENELIGLEGTFTKLNQKSICMFCNGYEEVGLFVSAAKGHKPDHFVHKGNYVCKDSSTCNQNLTTLENVTAFIEKLNERIH